MAESSAPIRQHLAPAEVAELLQIEIDEVFTLVHDGELRGAPVGSPARWRIEQASVREYLAAQSEHARRMALWRQSEMASFPEVWGSSSAHRR